MRSAPDQIRRNDQFLVNPEYPDQIMIINRAVKRAATWALDIAPWGAALAGNMIW